MVHTSYPATLSSNMTFMFGIYIPANHRASRNVGETKLDSLLGKIANICMKQHSFGISQTAAAHSTE